MNKKLIILRKKISSEFEFKFKQNGLGANLKD